MKIDIIKTISCKNIFLLLLLAILISCDSGGDSDKGDTQNADPVTPIMQPVPTVAPTSQPVPNPATPTALPTQVPATPTSSPGPAPTTPTPQPTPVPTPSPTPDPLPNDPPLNEFQSTVMNLVNAARAQGRNCGSEFFPAAPPVNWNTRIEAAALSHSLDMAQNQNLSHTGTDGSNPGDRLLMQDYDWRTWGENILVGLDDAQDAIDAWLGSSGHCSIIMTPSFEEIGAGVTQGSYQNNIASYWTLLFATEN